MTSGTRKLLLTIDQGGVPPHIKPLLASVVSATEYGLWGEVSFSTTSVEQLEESEADLADALEKSEAELQEVKQAGLDIAEQVELFCNSAEVVAVSMALKRVREAADDPELEDEQVTELLEQIDQTEEQFVNAVKELKEYTENTAVRFIV